MIGNNYYLCCVSSSVKQQIMVNQEVDNGGILNDGRINKGPMTCHDMYNIVVILVARFASGRVATVVTKSR